MDFVAYSRTHEDFQAAAQFQLRAMKISADHFDLGEVGEASRMASALFILVGEGMKSHTSIFDAANQKAKRKYRSTKKTDGELGCSLVHARLTKVADTEWEISLGHAGRTALEGGRDLPFNEWWSEIVILNDITNLSREEVVRILRDKNGGAHFDPVVKDEKTAKAIIGELGLFNIELPDGSLESVPFGLEYCMRQIATEFWYSIDENKQFNIPYKNNCNSAIDPIKLKSKHT